MQTPLTATRSLLLFFGLAYAISWCIWAPLYLPAWGTTGLPVLPYHHALGGLGPLIAGLLVTRLEQGSAGIDRLARSMVNARSFGLLLLVLTAPFAMVLAGQGISYLQQGIWPACTGIGYSAEFPEASPAVFFLYNLIFFGYGEETGWRGFALPRLQQRHTPFMATLLLTLCWALWHLPLFLYRPGYTGMSAADIGGWVFSLLTGSFLLSWLYRASGNSILVCAVFHATIDIAFTSHCSDAAVVSYTGAAITIWGLVVVWRNRRWFFHHS